MVNLLARAEISEGWTSIVLAETHLAEGNSAEAIIAIAAAEDHLKSARSLMEQPDSLLEPLTDLRAKILQVQSLVRRNAAGHA